MNKTRKSKPWAKRSQEEMYASPGKQIKVKLQQVILITFLHQTQCGIVTSKQKFY